MGMFDTVRSSYPLFSPEQDRRLQTKSLDCLMNDYWIDPAGRLWHPDYSGTFEIEDHSRPEDPPLTRLTSIMVPVPNGKRGVVRAVRFTGVVLVYPSLWDGPWEDLPERELLFVDGVMERQRAVPPRGRILSSRHQG